MVTHKAQAQFERSRWRLVLLLPIWTLQVLLTLGIMGLFAWRIGNTLKDYNKLKRDRNLPTIEFVWESTNVAFAFVAALCTFVEIGKFIAESLTPWTMLFTHVIKLTCAAAILALDIVIYLQDHDRHYSLIGLGMDAAFIITAAILALYATITYRRLSAADDYAHPANFKPYGFNDGLEPDSSSTRLLSTGRPSIDKNFSWQSLPRRSFSSNREEPAPFPPAMRSPSVYSHQRDTSFDEYIARRGSSQSSNPDAERQAALMAAGYGCYSPSSDKKLDIPMLTVTDMTHSRSRSLSLGHSPTYRSDNILLAVPEEDDEVPQIDVKYKADRDSLASAKETDGSRKQRPAFNHGRNRSVSYESKLNSDFKQRDITGYQPRESVDCPPVPQEVDVTETRWNSAVA